MNTTKIIKKSCLTLLFFSLCILAKAQTQVWQATPTVAGSILRVSKCATHSTGIYTAGQEIITSSNNYKLRITKHNYSGALLFSNAFAFGNLVNNVNVVKTECDASGNVYTMVNVSQSNTSNRSCYLISHSPSLALRWIRIINSGNDNFGVDFKITTTGSLYAALGHGTASGANYNIGIKKVVMSSGSVAYSGTSNNGFNMLPAKIGVDASGVAYVCGRNIGSNGGGDAFVSRFSNTGTHNWTAIYASAYFYDLTLDNFGTTVYVCGLSFTNNAGIVLKYNTSGANTAIYSLSNSNVNYFLKITYEVSGDVIVYGNSEIPGTTVTSSLLVTRLNGNLSAVVSALSYPTTTMANFHVNGSNVSVSNHPNGSRTISIQLASILAGGATFNTFQIRINVSGGVVFSGLVNGYETIYPVQLSSHANTDFISSNERFRIRRFTGAAARFGDDSISPTTNSNEYTAYPNPTSNELRFTGIEVVTKVKLLDMNGRVVLEQILFPNESLDVSTLPRGMYIANIIEERESKNLKLILE